jgi:AraC-like DNA-binding protein
MKLYIKNMVCRRCKLSVAAVMEKAGLHPLSVELGEVLLPDEPVTGEQYKLLETGLKEIGFELLDDKKSRIIEQIKTFIVEQVHYTESSPHKFSDRLSRKLHHDYSYLSNLFSQVEGITIEQYMINQKTERVKELLSYGEMSVNEIAFAMDYSSVAHLSNQFKKTTGLTPTQFKKSVDKFRKPLDEV